MATYGDTRTKFKARLNRRDCTDALADGFLQDAITRIQRIPRIPAMEKSVLVTLDNVTYFHGGDNWLAIPNDYLKLKDITIIDGTRQFTATKRDLGYVERLAACSSGTPTDFARRLGSFIFAPTPQNLTTQVRIDYWAEFATAINPADDMILLDIAQDAVVFGALSYACDHFNDKRGDRFEQRFTQIISDIQSMADDDELSGGAAVQPAFYIPEEHHY